MPDQRAPAVAKCAKCRNGTSGLVGHIDLFILRLDGKTMQFKCAGCGTLWTRTSNPQGSLDWSSTGEEMKGMPIPGWRARPPTAD